MIELDVTTTNAAIDRLLDCTEDPRHRYLLQSFHRHRYLEIAGRYEEIFVPEMMVEHPVYHFYENRVPLTLSGRDAVRNLYALWTHTSQCIFYAEDEQLAVGDHLISSNAIAYQQHPGPALAALGFVIDDLHASYLHRSRQLMLWSYDDRGRLTGENVWEVDPASARVIKLDPDDVLTPEAACELLDPLIHELPPFDEAVMGVRR
ncbi:MAG: hypothetical protein QOG94_3885 [Solirubrobacteraceae bacterium]|jgi:hypothetical protein|nr:hypothetical protein [Solirubrobacteraceae bacterium]